MASPSLALLRLQSDDRLVALVRAGHERPFEAIVERYRRPLLRHARRLVGEARAEDAVQQALLSAWGALRRGDEVRDLGAWLHRIVHNTALNALRGQRDDHAELRDSLPGGGAPQDVLEGRQTVRATLETVAALPERQREALLRVAVEGRSQEEVADALGLSHGAVRQLVHRARTTLRTAATALTPLPAASWLAAAGTRTEPIVARIAELAGGSSAGIGATLAKACTVAVIAGGAAAEPGLVGHNHERPRAADTARASTNEAPGAARRAPARPVGPAPVSSRPDDSGPGSSGRGSGGSDSSGRGSGGSDSSGRGSGRSGSSGPGPGGSRESDSSGPGSGGSSPTSPPADDSDSGSSGSGSSGSSPTPPPADDSGSGSSGSGSSGPGSGGSGSSGSGSATPAPASLPADDSGSGSSGSGSSGSGSSGSGSSGSGSGSSGSGSSGSGSGSSGSGSGDDSGSGSSGSGS